MVLSTDSPTIAAVRGHAAPAPAQIGISVSNDVYYVNYDVAGGMPEWLAIDGGFEGSMLIVQFSVTSTDLPEGSYPVVFTFYALDEDQDFLAEATVTLTLTVTETVVFAEHGWGPRATFGHSTQTQSQNVNVLAAGERWEVSADVPWIVLPAGIQEGSATLPIGIDSSALVPGFYMGTVELVNADDPTEVDSYSVELWVYSPNILYPRPFIVGGADGLDEAPRDLTFTLNTGTNSYPWEVTSITYSQGQPAWLQLSRTSGTVGGAGDTITVDALRDGVAPGSHLAYVGLRTQVLGQWISHSVTVDLYLEENRLYVDNNGIALHELPSRSRLSAEVQVLNSRGHLDVPWSASSDQPWLTVTEGGLTGGLMSLQADTTGLAADTVHVATITITSDDPAIDNDETVTVALWKGSQDATDIEIATPFDFAVPNPVFPYVHASKDNVLRTYNAYTGALVSTLTLPYLYTGAIAVTSDGRSLYVSASPWSQISRMDLATGEVNGISNRSGHTTKLAYVRIEGHEFPFTGQWFINFDVDIAPSSDSRRIFYAWNYESGSFAFMGDDLDYTALYGGQMNTPSLYNVVWSFAGQVETMALAADKERLLISVTAPEEFRLYNGPQQQLIWAIPATGTPNNTIVRSDDLLIVGSRATDESADIYLLDMDGALIDTLSSPLGALLDDQMALTSDPSRLMAPTDQDLIGIFEIPAP
jgi:hypothetical protein